MSKIHRLDTDSNGRDKKGYFAEFLEFLESIKREFSGSLGVLLTIEKQTLMNKGLKGKWEREFSEFSESLKKESF